MLSKVKNLQGQLSTNKPLAEYTSWRVGGPAQYLYVPANIDDLAIFLCQIPPHIPLFWLGLGSNVLIRDGGIEGVVIVTQGAVNKIEHINPREIRAEAGVASAQLARYSARLGLSGLEFMAGIPSIVGG